MNWYDVTRPLADGMLTYPGDIVPRVRQEDRGKYLLSCLRLGTHSGTHIDAPSHYLRGDHTVDRIAPDLLIGPCRVVLVAGRVRKIGRSDLEPLVHGAERVLIRTWFSKEHGFSEDYPGLAPDAAALLSGAGVRCIGIDSPSIEPFDGDGSVHRTLLSAGAVIIECMDLSAADPGEYWMAALPLRLEGLDGSPCRVFLRDLQ
jgi:arylformamidase